jgi:hypothetical protein
MVLSVQRRGADAEMVKHIKVRPSRLRLSIDTHALLSTCASPRYTQARTVGSKVRHTKTSEVRRCTCCPDHEPSSVSEEVQFAKERGGDNEKVEAKMRGCRDGLMRRV